MVARKKNTYSSRARKTKPSVAKSMKQGTTTVVDSELLAATISVHPRGFAFAAVEKPPVSLQIDQDVFIPPHALAAAIHNDQVLLKVTSKRRGRFEGEVVKVVKRSTAKLTGVYIVNRNKGMVIPEDDRYPFNITVKKKYSAGAKNNEAVVVNITSSPTSQHSPEGQIIEVLGDPDDMQVQTEIVIRKFELPHCFSKSVLKQLHKIDQSIVPTEGRVDLRDILQVTIDGDTARDFDDAVGVIKTSNGYRLYVSIADVSHYVTPGSPLDMEAYQRGTSVYFPTRVVPMLPEKLSNDLCSLLPDQDRFAFTAILDFDWQGKRLNKKFVKSIIRSRHRLTYTVVKEILVDKNSLRQQQYSLILAPLTWMAELAQQLLTKRFARGSIGFELPAVKVIMDGQDNLVDMVRVERNLAHKIIEEFMLAANEAVAETFATQNIEGLYRIHETPDPVKVAAFMEFAQSMGLKVAAGSGSPSWFGKVLKLAAGTPFEYIINNLLLRTMKQACYSHLNAGHFGLAATHYTHFTSPIRRYPDLMVHRVLAEIVGGNSCNKPSVPMAEAGIFLSKRERVAIEAERQMVARLTVRFMADKVNEIFDGIISGVTSFGLFVELFDNFVSGGVALTDLRDDYYDLDDKHHRLIGSNSGKIYQIGDLVRVQLKSVDKRRRRINFLVVK